jgi:hypothetical protein
MNLSNLDPNLVTGLVTLLGTLAAWGYHKARGTKQRDLTELLDDAITAEVEDALDDGETLDTIEDRLTQAGMALAKKLGLKVGEGTLRVAVQWGVVEFRKAVKKRAGSQAAAKAIPKQLDDLAAAADKVNDAFTPSGTFPKLGG